MANNQYLPSLNFQPYVKPYVPLPLKEIAEASTDLRNQYDANLANMNSLDLAMRQIKTLKADEATKQDLSKKIQNTINEIGKSDGRWEFKGQKITELAKTVQGDENLQAIMQSYQNAEDERKLFQQLNAQGKAIRFRPSDTHSTIITNPDGTVTRNIYTGDTQQKLDYRQRMEAFFNDMKAESMKSRVKGVGETVDEATGNIYSVDRMNMTQGISKSRIKEQAVKSLDTYLQTNEGVQQFRVLTELNGLSKDDARKQILNEFIATGLENENMSYDYADIQGVIKGNKKSGMASLDKLLNLNNTSSNAASIINSTKVEKKEDVKKVRDSIIKSTSDIKNKIALQVAKSEIDGFDGLTFEGQQNVLQRLTKGINVDKFLKDGTTGVPKYDAMLKPYENSLETYDKKIKVEDQRLKDASSNILETNPELYRRYNNITSQINNVPIIKGQKDAYSGTEFIEMLQDGRIIYDKGVYKQIQKNKDNTPIVIDYISKDSANDIVKLYNENKLVLNSYNNQVNDYLKTNGEGAIIIKGSILAPGLTREDQDKNTVLMNKQLSSVNTLQGLSGYMSAINEDAISEGLEGFGNIQNILKGRTKIEIAKDEPIKFIMAAPIKDANGDMTTVPGYSVPVVADGKMYNIIIPYENATIGNVSEAIGSLANPLNIGVAAEYKATNIIESAALSKVTRVESDIDGVTLLYTKDNKFKGVEIKDNGKTMMLTGDEGKSFLQGQYLSQLKNGKK